jgi:hypothetical protein
MREGVGGRIGGWVGWGGRLGVVGGNWRALRGEEAAYGHGWWWACCVLWEGAIGRSRRERLSRKMYQVSVLFKSAFNLLSIFC